MKIKKECIGLVMGSKIGMLKITEGNEELYTKLGLNIFEDETNEGSNDGKRRTKSKRKDDTVRANILVRVSERSDEEE
jgi:hypothetical protein